MNVLEIAANMVRNAVDTMSSKFSAFVKDEINEKVSTLYKPGGAATLATLPALTADNAGYVYDMSEAFTTSASFREGAGHKYPAGTNVVVSDVGDGVYKYDVLSGMLDGYVQESRKIGNVPLSADIPVTLTGDSAITVTNTGTASAIGYSVTHDDSGVTAGSKGDATNQTPGFGGTFKVLSATVDAKGHVTALGDHTVEIPDDPATTSKDGLMSKGDKAKLDNLSVTASNPLEVTKTGETYNVTLKDSGVTAGSKGDTTNQTPEFGGTFKVLSATVDAKGRITSLAEHSVQVPDTEATQSAKGLLSAEDKAKLDTLIDDTLSNAGKAADAKATGDSLSAFRELLRRMEIHCTASGNPATFSDADAANVKALSVTITPTQSGSGDPYPPGGGKNLLEITAESANINGIAFTVNRDAGGNAYSITASGTATADAIFYTGDSLSLTDGDYILSGCPSGGGWTKYGLVFGNIPNYGGDTSFSARTQRPYIRVGSGQTVNGLTFYPMIRRASDTDPTFAPYSNVRPISGVASVGATRTGKNIYQITAATLTHNGITFTVDANAGTVTANGTASGLAVFALNNYEAFGTLSYGPYILTGCPAGGSSGSYEIKIWSHGAGSGLSDYGNGVAINREIEWFSSGILIYPGVTVNHLTFRPMLRLASNADATFEPCRRQSVTVPLVDSNSAPLTVYGGTLNFVTGELTVTHKEFIPDPNGQYSVDRADSYPIIRCITPITDARVDNDDNYIGWICNRLRSVTGNASYVSSPASGDYVGIGSSKTIRFKSLSNFTDVAEFKAWLTENPLQVVYELAEPLTYQLTPQQLATLSGYNAVTTDAASVSVTYRADPSITLGDG